MGKLADTKEFSGDNLRNHFLIAMPGLRASMFAHSLTYICDHGPAGAMGLIVNRTLNLNLSEVFEQLEVDYREDIGRTPVLSGGPVSTERGFVLHPTGGQWQSSMQVCNDISLTSSRDIVSAIAEGRGPEAPLFILGYAGWGAGQLEEEIKENSWLTMPADFDILFRTPVEQRWSAAARHLGVDINLMPSTAGHA